MFIHCDYKSQHRTNKRPATPHILAQKFPALTYRPISFSEWRKEHLLKYIHRHIDPEINSLIIYPKIIVIHWTATNDFESAFQIFNNEKAPRGRMKLYSAGKVNVSVPFMIDRKGKIFQLMPENIFARHTIGLNHTSIGIENIGSARFPLNKKQLEANIYLIKLLKEFYDIEMIIGHFESGLLRNTKHYKELDKNYFSIKKDPGKKFIADIRKETGFEFEYK